MSDLGNFEMQKMMPWEFQGAIQAEGLYGGHSGAPKGQGMEMGVRDNPSDPGKL